MAAEPIIDTTTPSGDSEKKKSKKKSKKNKRQKTEKHHLERNPSEGSNGPAGGSNCGNGSCTGDSRGGVGGTGNCTNDANSTKNSSLKENQGEIVRSAKINEKHSEVADGMHKQEKKSKKHKKKKDIKRKRNTDPSQLEGNNKGSKISSSMTNVTGEREENNEKRFKKKRQTSKNETGSSTVNQSNPSREKETDDKIVFSSAIEFYPDDLKRLQLEKNQEMVLKAEEFHSNSNIGNGKVKPSFESLDTKKSKAPNKLITPLHGTQIDTKDIVKEHSKNNKETNCKIEGAELKRVDNITLLLFYQYVEPPWDENQFETALKFVTDQGDLHKITGRMRVAREGLNCTLTGSYDGIREWCAALRKFDGGRPRIDTQTGERLTEFAKTEFKLTDDLSPKQKFPKLHAFEVVELVNYGLAGARAPEIGKHGGTHLEPEDYHKKMCESDTVIIDVRNHYEANIGRFDPPEGGAKMIDPMMRKSTEFPVWLDKKETKDMLRGKQVLMYCTGGVRCERASALLKQKIETEDDTKSLEIKGVYQLQGGIDKYFKKYPQGGLWKGKNYVFDKRFAHAPPAVEAADRTKKILSSSGGDGSGNSYDHVGCDSRSEYAERDVSMGVEGTGSIDVPAAATGEIMGNCEACHKPWDMYRGKRRCPTCGVPSLICRDCFEADKAGTKKLGKHVRCDLCVAEGIKNKRDLREREQKDMKVYEQKLQRKLDHQYVPPNQRKHAITRKPKPNPNQITRLFLKNMCAKQMDETILLEFLQPATVTHIQWLTDRRTGKFYGSAFIEVASPEDAGSVLALNGLPVLGRKLKVKYQAADEKDVWPLPNTEVTITH